MKSKRVLLFIIFIVTLLILISTNVFALRAMEIEVYNPISVTISIIMKLSILLIFILYITFFIIYMFKSKKEKKQKIKKSIIWLVVAMIISLILFFTAEPVKEFGKTIKYESNSLHYLH